MSKVSKLLSGQNRVDISFLVPCAGRLAVSNAVLNKRLKASQSELMNKHIVKHVVKTPLHRPVPVLVRTNTGGTQTYRITRSMIPTADE